MEMSMDSGYWPFRGMLRHHLGWRFGERPDIFAERIETRLHAMVTSGLLGADEMEEIAPFMGNLLSVQFGNLWDHRLDGLNSSQIRYRTIAALSAFFRALAQEQPVVLVLEDLHWADDLSLDLTVRLMGELADRALLLLCIHRPAPQHRTGQLVDIAGAKCPERMSHIHLRALQPEQTRRLVEELLTVEALAPTTKEWVLARAQGNPFFTEEVLRALIDAGLIIKQENTWVSREENGADDPTPESIPSNVDTLIHARVDRLAPRLRQVLQIVAVVGRSVQQPILTALSPTQVDLEDQLRELEQTGLLYREHVGPDTEYTFHHVLTREAVYRMIPSKRRADLHHRIGAAIESVYADELGDQVERLAHHYAQTPDHAKAADYLQLAGDRARQAYLNRVAVRYYRDTLQRLEQIRQEGMAGHHGQRVADILYRLGRVHYALGEPVQAESALRRAISTAGEAAVEPGQLAIYYFWLCEALYWQQRHSDELDAAREGLRLLQKDEQSVAGAILSGHIACSSMEVGDRQTFLEITEWYSAFLPDLPFQEELSPAYHHAIDSALGAKDMKRAMRLTNTLLENAYTADDQVSLSKALYLRGRNLSLQGRFSEAIDIMRRSFDIARKTGETTLVGFTFIRIVDDSLALGRYQLAAEYLTTGAEELSAMPGIIAGDIEESIGTIHLCTGNWSEAEKHLRVALKRFETDDVVAASGENVLRIGFSLLGGGKLQQACSCFLDVANLMVPNPQIPPRPPDPQLKCGFVAAIAGLEETIGDSEEFRAVCARLHDSLAVGSARFNQWYLEPVEPKVRPGPPRGIELVDLLDEPWEWHDPFGDSTYSLEEGLIVEASDGRDLWFVNESAPRLVRSVAGDFALETSCSPVDPDRPAMGGLLLWRDLRNFVRLDRGARGKNEISFMGCIDGEHAIFGRGRLPSNQVTLRLERSGKQIRALCSADGQQWYRVGEITLAVEGMMEAGIVGLGYVDRSIYSGQPAGGGALRFESLTLEQPPLAEARQVHSATKV